MQYSAYTGRHLSTRRRWMAMPPRSWTAKTDWRERFRSRKPWTVRSRSSCCRARLKYWCRNGRRHRPQIARLGSRDRVFTAGANTTTWFGRTVRCNIGHRPDEHHHQERRIWIGAKLCSGLYPTSVRSRMRCIMQISDDGRAVLAATRAQCGRLPMAPCRRRRVEKKRSPAPDRNRVR